MITEIYTIRLTSVLIRRKMFSFNNFNSFTSDFKILDKIFIHCNIYRSMNLFNCFYLL